MNTKVFLKQYSRGEFESNKIPEKPYDFSADYLLAPESTFEQERLKTLYYYRLLNNELPAAVINIIDQAKKVFRLKQIYVNIIDDNSLHLTNDNHETFTMPKEKSLCGHTILQKNLFEVSDIDKDWRFVNNPQIESYKSYLGSPLLVAGVDNNNTYAIGTMCVIDDKPYIYTDEDKDTVNFFTDAIVTEFN